MIALQYLRLITDESDEEVAKPEALPHRPCPAPQAHRAWAAGHAEPPPGLEGLPDKPRKPPIHQAQRPGDLLDAGPGGNGVLGLAEQGGDHCAQQVVAEGEQLRGGRSGARHGHSEAAATRCLKERPGRFSAAKQSARLGLSVWLGERNHHPVVPARRDALPVLQAGV